MMHCKYVMLFTHQHTDEERFYNLSNANALDSMEKSDSRL